MRPYYGKRKPQGTMNKLEHSYSLYLEALKQGGQIHDWKYESMKFRLADKTFYTPDFVVVFSDRFEFHEVKGFWEDDARVKIKVVAEQYRFFKFIAIKYKQKQWMTEEF